MRPYQGQRLSLLTQHGKEQVIKPVLDQWCGSEVVHTQAFDTDTLGTFTRDVERSGTQLDAARKKARIGTALTGLKMGLASEGSFSSDPCTGMFSWNYELVCCPQCGSAGFWVRDFIRGLPCRCCGQPTALPLAKPRRVGLYGISRARRNPVAVPRLPSEALPR